MSQVTVEVEIESCSLEGGALSCDELKAYPDSSLQKVEAIIVDGEATKEFMTRFTESHKDLPAFGLGSVREDESLPFIFERKKYGGAFIPAHKDGNPLSPVRSSPSMSIFPKTRPVSINARGTGDSMTTSTTLSGRTIFFDSIWAITTHEHEKVQMLARSLLKEDEPQAEMILRVNHLPPDHHVLLTVYQSGDMRVHSPSSTSPTFYQMYTHKDAMDQDQTTKYFISRKDQDVEIEETETTTKSATATASFAQPTTTSFDLALFLTSLVVLVGILVNFGTLGIQNYRRRTRLMLMMGILLGLLLIPVHLLEPVSTLAPIILAALPLALILGLIIRMRAFGSVYLLASLAFFAVHFTWILMARSWGESSPSPALALVSAGLFVLLMMALLSPLSNRMREKVKASIQQRISNFNR